MRLHIATKNPGKIRELYALLAALQLEHPLELIGIEEMPEVEETGETFAANAELKARAAALWSGGWAIADDSGLEVDALDGAPGVHSNRFAGEGTTEASRNQALLDLLKDVPPEARTARYRAAIALAAPDGRLWVTEGTCQGLIVEEPRGEAGFGYDPHFYVPEHGKTMAELDPAVKNRLSHRYRALQAAAPLLEHLCREV